VHLKDKQPQSPSMDPWCIRESGMAVASHFLNETLFALGNGYIGLRGTNEEGYSGSDNASLDGTYLNGFYESESIQYPENAYGLARQNQFMLNVPNGKGIACWVEDERFDLSQGTVIRHERTLDFRAGMLVRELEWISPRGRRIEVKSKRLVCFERKHVYAMQFEVKPLNFSGRIRLSSTLDGAVKNLEAGDDPRVGSTVSGPALQLQDIEQGDVFAALTHRTRHSGFSLVSAISNELHFPGAVTRTNSIVHQRIEQSFDMHVAADEAVKLYKYGCYFSSRDYPESELAERARQALQLARTTGFDALGAEQRHYLAQFWQRADVEIVGDDALQQGMHFNQFHLLQSVGRDGKTNIAAKGVTGEGYEGHYFWDTEIYIFPFFLYSKPEIARKLLEYRYGGLEKARERARQMSHEKGALFPWRTIAGEECSAYYPAGTAQYHINADIAYSIKQYLEATGDEAYLLHYGAEIVLETARIWIGIGTYAANHPDRFCINEVTGPDEYTALVNNNYYTNLMAQMHLRFAADIVDKIQAEYPEQFKVLAQVIDLDQKEPAQWRHAADHMYLPYDEVLGIHPQDDSFLSKKVWDFAATPDSNYPLLLHYHPLVIYRHQVCKQADTVLALLLQGDKFTLEEKRRDFDYYEKVTTHDSSLSSCIFSIIASEIGYRDRAYSYFMETARLDLDDMHGNTCYGVHTAGMAGTWMSVAYGFGGMRVYQGNVSFAPILPAQWQHYKFHIHFKGQLLQVKVAADGITYNLLEGAGLDLFHRGHPVRLDQAVPARAFPMDQSLIGERHE
jgi:alpha,alpha-trehalose phosphorylase